MKLKTKRLILTPMSDEETEILIANEPDEEMRAAYGEMLAGSEQNPDDRLFYTPWKIALKTNPDERIGDLCFKGPQKKGRVEIGYGMLPAYEGHGYMTEAAEMLTAWALCQKDVYFVEAETAPENKASQRVLEKIGFRPNGQTGEEGPRFEMPRREASPLALGICFGPCIGSSIGVALKNVALGISVGMLFGVAFGALLQRIKKKRRDEVLEISEGKPENASEETDADSEQK